MPWELWRANFSQTASERLALARESYQFLEAFRPGFSASRDRAGRRHLPPAGRGLPRCVPPDLKVMLHNLAEALSTLNRTAEAAAIREEANAIVGASAQGSASPG